MSDTQDKATDKDIRWVRKLYGFSHREIAQALGVSPARVQRVLAASRNDKRAA